jgi:hypothetical protein
MPETDPSTGPEGTTSGKPFTAELDESVHEDGKLLPVQVRVTVPPFVTRTGEETKLVRAAGVRLHVLVDVLYIYPALAVQNGKLGPGQLAGHAGA